MYAIHHQSYLSGENRTLEIGLIRAIISNILAIWGLTPIIIKLSNFVLCKYLNWNNFDFE